MTYKFTHTPTQEDGGGTLTVETDDPKEIQTAADVFGIVERGDVLGLADLIRSERLNYTSAPKKRMWYAHEVTLHLAFSHCYAHWLEDELGYRSVKPLTAAEVESIKERQVEPNYLRIFEPSRMRLPALDLTHRYRKRCVHTHIVDSIRINEDGCFVVSGFDQAEPWNGMTAAKYSAHNFLDYVAEDIGTRHHEREYKEAGNGSYVRNPNYLKRYAAAPACGIGGERGGSVEIANALYSWWYENWASAGQKALIRRNHEAAYPNFTLESHRPPGPGYSGFFVMSSQGNIDYDGKGKMARLVTKEEFRTA